MAEVEQKPWLVVHLTDEQKQKLADFKKAQDNKVMQMQKGTPMERNGFAYYGAIGGAYTYKIGFTSLGQYVSVVNELTKEELDLTDYDSW